MKRLLTVALCLTFVWNVCLFIPTATAQSADPLTNEIIVKMVKDGLSPDIIVAKINASSTRFETSGEAMGALKQAGVSDAVILAMVQSNGSPKSALSVAAVPSAVPLVEQKVTDGLSFEVELARNASSEELKVGDMVDFIVSQPLVVNGVTVIEKGATARATVTEGKKAGRWGKSGKLQWAMKDVTAADGQKVPLRFTQRTTGESKGGTVAVAAVATTVLLGPLGLLWGFKKGKPAIIPAGNRYSVFTHGEANIKGRQLIAAVQ